jgi:ABC-type lipoprotein export system ATPase subunit
MIHSVTATGGYAKALEAVGGRTFTISPGLNVLFGPNGCGKSTLLRLAAGYTGAPPNGGWSDFVQPSCDDLGRNPRSLVYPQRFRGPGNSKAKVEWDGVAAFFYAGDSDGSPMYFEQNDGLSGGDLDDVFAENVRRVMSKGSTGQERISRWEALAKQLRSPPDLTKMAKVKQNETWMDARQAYADYVSSLPRSGRVTLIADEPDRSLSIPNQVEIWKILLGWSKKIQIIAATHSPFALAVGKANLVDMVPGYLDSCRDAVHQLARSLDGAPSKS